MAYRVGVCCSGLVHGLGVQRLTGNPLPKVLERQAPTWAACDSGDPEPSQEQLDEAYEAEIKEYVEAVGGDVDETEWTDDFWAEEKDDADTD